MSWKEYYHKLLALDQHYKHVWNAAMAVSQDSVTLKRIPIYILVQQISSPRFTKSCIPVNRRFVLC